MHVVWMVKSQNSGACNLQTQYVIQQGCIKPMVDLLDEQQEVKLLQLVLDGMTSIIKAGKEYTPNPCVNWIEEAGGVEKIENLQV
jgi:importin subunit alpha-6/7